MLALIETPTVFIVGAGASKEAGLPIGSELTKDIARRLGVKENTEVGQRTVDLTIAAALRIAAAGNTPIYFRAAQDISAAMPLAPSIDNFLDAHRGNREIVTLGKIGIATSILSAERNSKLYVDTSNSYNTVRFSELELTWFVRLWHILSTGIDTNQVDKIFSNVSFVIFNYDRCIEQFLYYALNTYFKIGSNRAREVMGTLTVIHPYGQVGEIFAPINRVAFGEDLDPQKILDVAKHLKTFTEQTDDSAELDMVHSIISQAEKLVFLGFAYHPINMRLLTSGRLTRARKIFGTSMGMSESDAEVVAESIRTLLREGSLTLLGAETHISNTSLANMKPALLNGTCFDLFNHYSQSIGR